MFATQTIIKGGTINSDTIWDGNTNGVYIVEGTVTLVQGATLTISPGTIIKFKPNTYGLNIQGKLEAIGTEENPIIFTAFKDADYGGSGVSSINDSWMGIDV